VKNNLLTAFAILFICQPMGCSCDEELVKVPDPQLDVVDLTTEERSSEGMTEIVVGQGELSADNTRAIRLESYGNRALRVSEVVIERSEHEGCTAAAASVFSVDPFAGSILTGEAKELNIHFQPLMPGPACADLVLRSDDKDEPEMRILLRGVGAGPALCVTPAPVLFGEVFRAQTTRREVVLSNCGTRQLDVSELAIEQDGDGYTLSDDPAPEALEVGAEITASIELNPRDEREYTGFLLVSSNDPSDFGSPRRVPLQGFAVSPPACRISVTPETVNFGQVAGGSAATRRITVTNVGGLDCSVRDMVGPLGLGSEEFVIETDVSWPLELRGSIDDLNLNAEPRPDISEFTLTVRYESPQREAVVHREVLLEFEFDDNELGIINLITVNLIADGGGARVCRLSVQPQGGGLLGPLNQRYGVLQFGRVVIGSEKIMPIRMTNIGSELCELSSIIFDPRQTPDREFRIVGDHDGVLIIPGEEYRVDIAFAPTHTATTSSGTYQPMRVPPGGAMICNFPGGAELCGNGVTIITNSPQVFPGSGDPAGVFSIGFSATPAQPDIDVLPGQLEFGVETVGCGSVEKRVSVYNLGNADLTINNIAIDPGSDPEFRITRAPGPFPIVVEPDQNIEVLVRFFPRRQGLLEGLLVIDNNDGDEQNFTIPLTGTGTTETHQIDRFEQADEPMVDVLWVVDDSGSMSEEQTNLANNFGEFIRFATQELNVDFHIAVTTTLADGDMAGVYNACESPKFLTRNTPDLESKFRCNVQVSRRRTPARDGSDSREAGLEAARYFLSRERQMPGGLNEGFLREQAKLYIIAVSDEEDQSRGPVGLYEDAFRQIKGIGNRDLINFSAITGTGANGRGCEAQRGARYMELAANLNGVNQDICAQNWRAAMRALGLDTFAFRTAFALSRRPRAETIVVRIGGQNLARGQQGGQSGWVYNRADNAVVFNPTDVPARGTQIEVEYDTLCAQ
jgi:hypothetical protein